MAVNDRENLVKPFIWSVVIAGLGVLLFSTYRLNYSRLDGTFIVLAIITILIGSRISVSIPYVQGEVTVSDTLIFLSLLLYGGEPAILLATAEAFCTSLRFSKKVTTHCFNAAVMACSCFLTASTLRFCFGEIVGLRFWPVSGKLIIALYVMALVQYFSNSSLIAVYNGLKSGQPIWKTWNKYYLYTLATYLASASAAGLIVRLISLVSIYAFLAVVPILAVVYFTYWSYLKQVEAKSLQIEQAQNHVAELQESEARFRSAFDHAAIGMALVDPLGHWLQVNRSLCEITGYSEDELLASNYQAITHRDDLGTALIQMHQMLDGRLPAFHMEKRYLHRLGHTVWVLWSVSMARDVATSSDRLIFQVQDITDRKRAEEQLLHDAFHDGLTGLPNRALFIDHLKMVIERNKRHKERQYAVLFLDFDRFKIINDSLGHVVGDYLLIAIARRLENCLRPGDTIARLGGDEFTILLDEIKSVNEAVEVTERIQKSLEQAFVLSGNEIFTTVSIGIAHSSLGYEKPEDMLRDADTAMYRAKAIGSSHHEIFDKAMHSQAMSRLHMENDLRKAIERGEFILHYQPIVALDDGRLEAFEALIRWQHPEHGLVSPAQFIPVSEETGLIIPIGHWVLREACRQMKEWQTCHSAHAHLQMSVNLSSKQFIQPDLLGQIKDVLQETGLDPRCLKLEITESVVMENIETAISLLQEIRALGIELSIDDFGTGYSSLSYLHRFPLSTLKIDRSFVMQMGDQNENTEIVRTIIMLAGNLNMDVVAEGIETAEQLAALRWLECKYGQGYYFSRPVDAPTATELVRNNKQWEVMQAALLFMNQKASAGRYSS